MDDEKLLKLAGQLVDERYVSLAGQALRSRKAKLRVLLEHKRLPDSGWDADTVEWVVREFASLDSNQFIGNVGVGEREARLFSGLVSRRHFGFGHGVGRSGDLAAVQPKAAGASLCVQLCARLALDAVREAGLREVRACLVVPLATGMSLALVFSALRARRDAAGSTGPWFVVWPRIDQKSCFKSVLAAGLTPIVVENRLEGDEVRTDVDAVEQAIRGAPGGPGRVLAVLSTTSCFAPRAPDRVEALARLCKALDVAHVVNNAYGLQSAQACADVSRAMRVGRVDAVVQSTDKNFMVPVGGSLVACQDPATVQAVSQAYAGRASGAPALDLFITLLEMGRTGYRGLLAQRQTLFVRLRDELGTVAGRHGERLLDTGHNEISIAMSLKKLASRRQSVTFLGSMLFARFCSGSRVVDVPPAASGSSPPGSAAASKQIGPHCFLSWGAHMDRYPEPYLTVACAVGMQEHEITVFCKRLDSCLKKVLANWIWIF